MKCKKENAFGKCNGNLRPNVYWEKGKTMVCGLTCDVCGRQEITNEMTYREFLKAVKEE